MSQPYSFPLLSDQELIPWLREFDMPLTAAQLSKPTYEIVRPVFELAVSTLVGVTRQVISVLIRLRFLQPARRCKELVVEGGNVLLLQGRNATTCILRNRRSRISRAA